MDNTKNTLTVKESRLIQNIVNKLNAYMIQNGQTLFGLSQTTGFAYQPLNRLMNGTSVPTLSSLATLSDYLNCSISELIDDEFFIDVDVVNSVDELIKQHTNGKSRVYIPYAEFMPHISKKFFILAESENIIVNKVFYLTNEIVGDGEFMVIYNKIQMLMNVVLSSSKFILIEKDGQEQRIPADQVTVLAQLFRKSVMCGYNGNIRNSLIMWNT